MIASSRPPRLLPEDFACTMFAPQDKNCGYCNHFTEWFMKEMKIVGPGTELRGNPLDALTCHKFSSPLPSQKGLFVHQFQTEINDQPRFTNRWIFLISSRWLTNLNHPLKSNQQTFTLLYLWSLTVTLDKNPGRFEPHDFQFVNLCHVLQKVGISAVG